MYSPPASIMSLSNVLDYSDYLLVEAFVNAFEPSEKEQYADGVWDILKESYSRIGGLKGRGFASKEDMVKNIAFWKIGKTSGKVNAVAMYRDKGGRKRVAVGTDGTDDGKRNLMLIVKDDLTTGRSYSELSERFLGFAIKNIPNFKKYAVPLDDVKKKVGDEEIRRPDDDDPEVIRHPDLKDYFYMREIGGGWHTKLMVGNVNAPNIQI